MSRNTHKYWLFILGITAVILVQSCSYHTTLSVGFYNVENLFDTKDNPDKIDEQYLPNGDYKWDEEKYDNKIDKLAHAISEMTPLGAPYILGLCEVENKAVLKDLVAHADLKHDNYGIVHYESPDARGIDVALLYNKRWLKVKKSKNYVVDLGEFGDETRDILMVKLKAKEPFEGTLYVLVNHWPSRREGKEKSEPKRVAAAKRLNEIRQEIIEQDSAADIIIMGDFNDEPFDKSILETIGTTSDPSEVSANKYYNPMGRLKQDGKGSYNFRGNWNMLDQIIVSNTLLDKQGTEYQMNTASIFSPEWLKQHGGKYDGYPLRTFGGRKYLNGYSDHFPVSIYLKFSYE